MRKRRNRSVYRVRKKLTVGQGHTYFFFHLAAAAFLAICFLLRGVSDAALALPPFNPPRRPALTAEGSFSDSGADSGRVNPSRRASRLRISWSPSKAVSFSSLRFGILAL